jgi:hypothetical protein
VYNEVLITSPNLVRRNMVARDRMSTEDLMLSHGCIKKDFDVDRWAAPEFLEKAATEVLKEEWERRSWSKLAAGGGLEAEGTRLG